MSDGLEQLADEGAIQVFEDSTNIREPILAAVGVLQFDVVRSRLDVEYGVKVEIESLKFKAAAKLNPGLTFRQFSEELFVPEK